MELIGKNINLRFVEKDDAEFIVLLRSNIKYNKYLSFVDDDINKQKDWIEKYKERENNKQEYYYIIQLNKDNTPIGTVRVYDFITNENSFCWGSWILNENKTRYSALECAILIYDFAFTELGFRRCHMDIRKDNTKMIEFHKRFGVKIIGETKLDLLGHYFYGDYMQIRDDIIKIIDKD